MADRKEGDYFLRDSCRQDPNTLRGYPLVVTGHQKDIMCSVLVLSTPAMDRISDVNLRPMRNDERLDVHEAIGASILPYPFFPFIRFNGQHLWN